MLWINRLIVVFVVQGIREMAVLPAVTEVLLHHIAMDKWTDCRLFNTGHRGNGGSTCGSCSTVTSQCYRYVVRLQCCLYRVERKLRFLLQLLQYCYITVLWIHGLTAVLIVQCRREMAVLTAVTAILLHHSAMDT